VKAKVPARLADHPTVRTVLARKHETPGVIDADWLHQLCLEAGVDDVAFARVDNPDLASEREHIEAALPGTQSYISLVVKMNRDNVRSTARSVANQEFHRSGERLNEAAHKITRILEDAGYRALSPSATFPMEMDNFPGRIWVVAHKPVAVAAGLGVMGIHRNVIHPKFGNFILLGTVLMDAELSQYSQPIDYNPCLECKLCVAACPTGAIGSDGSFDFSACYTHNYREFMGGFNDWVEKIADSKSALDYRKNVSGAESVSMWQSLSFGANYKAAYCLSVCPAGEEVIAPFLTDRKEFLKEMVKPLQDKVETVYVVPGSDAEDHVARRFPHKKTKRVANGLAGQGTIRTFLRGLNFVFQRGKSEGLNATYHFTFTGQEEVKATVVIRDKRLEVSDGHTGTPDFQLTADSQTWLRFLRKEANLVWALLRRKIRIHGSPKLLLAFARCFPS
jgi:NAD-dependent dihydropyrimidine dehydrogenase PreA subunit